MKVVIAPDSFQGSLASHRVAEAIGTGWKSVRANDDVISLPLADGGEGTLDVIRSILGGELISTRAQNPIGATTDTHWLLLSDGTAIIEMALINGLNMLEQLQPLRSHTQGLGELIREAALDSRCKKIVIALGGSATSDGGMGALYSLGAKFLLNSGGNCEPTLFNITEIEQVDLESLLDINQPIQLLVDVTNPLLGDLGAAKIFSPQKGATSEDVEFIEIGLSHFCHLISGDPRAKGMGAAGGTAMGLSTGLNAEIVSGAEMLMQLSRVRENLIDADVLITGEGRLDSQSLNGKLLSHLLHLSADLEVKTCAVVGQLQPCAHSFDEVEILADLAPSQEAAMANPEKYLHLAGQRLAESIGASD